MKCSRNSAVVRSSRRLASLESRLSSGRHSLDLTIWPSRRNADDARGASVSAPALRALRVCAVGKSLLGHDVSGTGRQTLGRMMLSITTMVPGEASPPRWDAKRRMGNGFHAPISDLPAITPERRGPTECGQTSYPAFSRRVNIGAYEARDAHEAAGVHSRSCDARQRRPRERSRPCASCRGAR
jgi:hypothetical protein